MLKEIKNSNPILLIDDVFGELDSSRRIKFLSLLPKESQKIITTTNLEWLGNNQLGSYRKYLIEDGIINTKYPIYQYSPGSKQIDGVTSATSQYFANKGLLYAYRDGKRVDPSHLHVKDWLDAIRSGGQPKCNVDVALEEAVTCAMATESYLTGRRVEWDPINRKLI